MVMRTICNNHNNINGVKFAIEQLSYRFFVEGRYDLNTLEFLRSN